MTPRTLLLTLMLTGAVAHREPRVAGGKASGRPVILVVHGRGFLSRDSAVFHSALGLSMT